MSIRRLLTTLAASTLALSCQLSAGQASAATHDPQFLVLSTAALHFKNQSERNDFTPGVGWEYSPSGKLGFHVGTLSDSFGYQAKYGGINYATQRHRVLGTSIRILVGATVVNKQFRPDSEPKTKVVPLPAMEIGLTRNAVLNVSGSPEIDYAGDKSNAVMFFQLKLNLQ